MRFILSLLVACFIFTSAPADAQQAPTPSASHVAAARDMLQALLLDNGAVETSTGEAFRVVSPGMRANIVATDFYANLTSAHKQALDAAFERLPGQLGAEARRIAPALLDEYAPRFAGQMSEQSLIASAAFLRTAEGRAWALSEIRHGVITASASGAPPPPLQLSDAEARAAQQFTQSTAGMEFNSPGVGALSNELGSRAAGAPSVAAMFKGELCAAVEEQCPPGWRS